MHWFLLIGGGWLAYQAYKTGKRIGSRKGYGVGQARQRRTSNRRYLQRLYR